MFEETVTTKNGVVKRIVASSRQELDEAVKAAKNEQTPDAPNIHDPRDGNKIVSPDNKHTENPPVQPPEGSTEPTAESQGAENEIRKVEERKNSDVPQDDPKVDENSSKEPEKEAPKKSKKTK